MRITHTSCLVSHLLVCVALTTCIAEIHAQEPLSHTDNVPIQLKSQVIPACCPSWAPESILPHKDANVDSKIADLETELADLRAMINADSNKVAIPSRSCTTCNTLYGVIEVTFLSPQFNGAYPAFFAANGGRVIDEDFQAAVRYVIGYRNSSGFGIRGRFWSFGHGFDFVPPFTPGLMRVNALSADLEMTQLQHFRHWDLELSGGMRFGKFGYESTTAGPFGLGEAYFQGLGPTIAIDARRALGRSGFSVYGNARTSILFGEIKNASLLPAMPPSNIQDDIASTFNCQLGVAWSATVFQDSCFEIRAAWETQYWLNDTLADDSFGVGSNLGLMGPSIAVELRY